MKQLTFLNRRSNIRIQSGHLPHWFQPEATQFITLRLADSLPQVKLQELAMLRVAARERYDPTDDEESAEEAIIEQKTEEWLKRGYGSCILRKTICRKPIEDFLLFHDKSYYTLYAFVIMPNHMHILMSPNDFNDVTSIIGSLKRYSSRLIKKCLNSNNAIWQREMFDRMVRNEDYFVHNLKYIVDNPSGLPADEYTLYVAPEVKYLI